ncbi:MAG: HAD family hydrolase [Bdellovibrionales bacterium]|nr:HAD family hydrolase [Bdellovibrionales bacterium]
MKTTDVLRRIEEFLSSVSPKKKLVIFDLDSTLYDVSWRTKQILNDCANSSILKSEFPESAKKLKGLSVLSTDWGIKEALIRSDIQENLKFFDEVRKFWMEHFFANRYLKYDRPYDGAVSFVQHFYSSGIPIAYLTGRDRKRMYEGSLYSLAQCGFPVPPDPQVQLIMKEDREVSDAIYKRDRLRPIVDQYEEVLFFENEPRIIELVQRDCPSVNIVFVKSVHSGVREDPEHLLRIDSRFPSLSHL